MARCCRRRSTMSCGWRSRHATIGVVEVRSLDLDQMVAYHLDEGPVYDGALDLVKAAIADAGLDVGVIGGDLQSEAPPGQRARRLVGARDGGRRRRSRCSAGAADAPTSSRGRPIGSNATISASAAAGRINTPPPCGGLQPARIRARGGHGDPVADRDADERASPGAPALLHGPRPAQRRVDRPADRAARGGREETLLGMKRLQEMAYAMRDVIERGRPRRPRCACSTKRSWQRSR